jgi:curved DNA-binding protein
MAVAFRDYYDALGVPRTASEDEIRTAYRRLARQYHPDVNKEEGAEERFKEVSEAYEVLRDQEKRARYDRLGANWKAGEPVGGGTRAGAGAGGRPGGGFDGFEGFQGFDGGDVRFDFGGGGAGGGDFSDFFESLFGGAGGGATARGGGRRRRGGAGTAEGFSLRGGDQEATVELTLEEAFHGGKRRFQLSDGRDYEVNIPPGVRDGQRIRLAGEGGEGVGGGPRGDLYLRVRILPHPRFRREGRDLEVDLPVTPPEAALGARVPVPTLEGTARVRVRAGTSSGQRLRLKGEGMPGPKGERGDLFAVVKIMVPKKLSSDEREAYERLAEVSDFNPREWDPS